MVVQSIHNGLDISKDLICRNVGPCKDRAENIIHPCALETQWADKQMQTIPWHAFHSDTQQDTSANFEKGS